MLCEAAHDALSDRINVSSSTAEFRSFTVLRYYLISIGHFRSTDFHLEEHVSPSFLIIYSDENITRISQLISLRIPLVRRSALSNSLPQRVPLLIHDPLWLPRRARNGTACQALKSSQTFMNIRDVHGTFGGKVMSLAPSIYCLKMSYERLLRK